MAPTVNHLHVTCKRVLPLQPHLCIELWNEGLHTLIKLILTERRFSLQALPGRGSRGILTPTVFHCLGFPQIPSRGGLICIRPRGWRGIPCLWLTKMPRKGRMTALCKGFPCVFQSFSLLRTSNPERRLCIRTCLRISLVGKPRWSQRLLPHSWRSCCYAGSFRRPVGPRNEVGVITILLDLCAEVGSFRNQWVLFIWIGFLMTSNLIPVFHFWGRWGLVAIAYFGWRCLVVMGIWFRFLCFELLV